MRALARFCPVVLVNEYYTSRRCHVCRPTGTTAASFVTRSKANPRDVHCSRCQRTHNRDANASANIAEVVYQWLHDGTRPEYLDSPAAFQYSKSVDPVAWTSHPLPSLETITDSSVEDLVAARLMAAPKRKRQPQQGQLDADAAASAAAVADDGGGDGGTDAMDDH